MKNKTEIDVLDELFLLGFFIVSAMWFAVDMALKMNALSQLPLPLIFLTVFGFSLVAWLYGCLFISFLKKGGSHG